jgi:hypothetical protein
MGVLMSMAPLTGSPWGLGKPFELAGIGAAMTAAAAKGGVLALKRKGGVLRVVKRDLGQPGRTMAAFAGQIRKPPTMDILMAGGAASRLRRRGHFSLRMALTAAQGAMTAEEGHARLLLMGKKRMTSRRLLGKKAAPVAELTVIVKSLTAKVMNRPMATTALRRKPQVFRAARAHAPFVTGGTGDARMFPPQGKSGLAVGKVPTPAHRAPIRNVVMAPLVIGVARGTFFLAKGCVEPASLLDQARQGLMAIKAFLLGHPPSWLMATGTGFALIPRSVRFGQGPGGNAEKLSLRPRGGPMQHKQQAAEEGSGP